MTQLETPRLFLIPVTPAVITGQFKSVPKEEIMQFFGADESRYVQLFDMFINGMETNRLSLFFFLLKDKSTNQVIGECGFHTLNKFHRRAELFYTLNNEQSKRKGIMTETLPVVLEYGFTSLGLHRIQACTASSNIASTKLLLKNRFLFEGVLRQDYFVNGVNEDSNCYSLLAPDWAKSLST